MAIQGLIFDFDGTLADTMPLHWKAWGRVMEKHGITITEERFYSLGGVPARDIIRMLADEQGAEIDHASAVHDKGQFYLDILHEAELIELTMKVVREHHGTLPMAIATGGSRRIVTQVIEKLGIGQYFDALVTNEDIENQKPAPDIFLEAARRIGVAPENCRAYEDTDLGMQAIRAAGMEAIDVRPLRGMTVDVA